MSEQVAVSSSGVGEGKLEKTKEIMRRIGQYNKYTLGDFFETLLSSSDQLDASSQTMLSKWLTGSTRPGTRPAEIVDAIYRHPYSLKHVDKQPQMSEYKNLRLPQVPSTSRSHRAMSFLPPKATGEEEIERARYNAREGLEEWAARLMLHRVDFEAGLLERNLQKSANPTWEKLEDFSLSRERAIMKANAPVLWGVLSVAGLARRKNARQGDDLASNETDSGEDSDSDWDSELERRNQSQGMARGSAQKSTELGVASSIYILIGSRNRLVGFFRTLNGVSLFTSGAPKFVYRLLSRLRLSPSHRTQLAYLESLAASAKVNLRKIGQSAFSAPQDSSESGSTDPDTLAFMLLFDNIQRYVKPRTATVSNRNTMKTGTAATLVILHNVAAGAFDRGPYFANILLRERQNLTLDDLYAAIDQAHLERIGTATIMRILVNNVQALRHFKKDVENRFKDPNYCAKRPQVTRKSRIYPMATSGINEGTAGGAVEVLDDLISQLGIPLDRFDTRMCSVGGDHMSIHGLRQARRYLEQEETIYKQKDWVLPIIQGWHMGWAFLKAIFKSHYYDVPGKHTLGLRRSLGALGHDLNVETCEYYPCFNALMLVFDSMVLSAARVVLKQNHPGTAQEDDSEKAPQLLEELNILFNSQGAGCSMESLEKLANQVYKEYLTTEAYQLALSPNGDSEPSAADLENILGQNMEKLRLDVADGVSSSRSLTEHRQNLPNTTILPSSSISGDHVLANNKLLMRECFFMAEFDAAMTEGDPGRMLEVMNVFLFAFWGTNSTNYGNELLEMICNLKYEYPPNMKQAIIDNMLVNPSGLPKHWQAGDLLQEHHNLKIKTIYNSKSSDFDDKFLRESVSLNIAGLSKVEASLLQQLGLTDTDKRHAAAKRQADTNVLGAHLQKEKVFEFTPSRSQPYEVADMIGAGYDRLSSGALQDFLSRTTVDPDAVVGEDDE